ncbi:unnamed protein product [Nippostrongylus brasiliensis]|uniref:NAD_binding_2 domain-containing protein n=1 Tax=Nippostrongylus brasiliensis TaxID=27835 RepID=A0A0N4YQ07_NIPBR|nr:unnamed protein product [Nippostrongylus brasiliensis]
MDPDGISTTRTVSKNMRERELRNAIASQPQLSPKVTFSFLRIIVNDDEKTVVSENLINAMKDITSTDVVLACTPQRVGRYLRSLSAGAIDGPRSLHGLTTVYAAAGLRAQWCGKVGKSILLGEIFGFSPLSRYRSRYRGHAPLRPLV